ncbi:S1 family peptidase [Actinomadura rubrisoli]|uniref:S1 family peptidase n=1 Tax=Actinomadura rubrisoli TaxID=2530368 RepID=A0A4R5C4L3_9ACTN|nr:S1 family peptidase [Actinomadura rubrisoli]TDD93023.1 S1 family peptidase [Actinomadura rubrisoli]
MKPLTRLVLSAAALSALPAVGTVPATAATHAAGTVQQARPSQTALADQLTGRLGSQQAGAYVDGTGNLVVNVTTAAAAQQVEAAGLKSRLVDDSMRALDDSKGRLDLLAGSAGTTGLSWGVDVVSNSVVVSVPKGADDAATNAFVKRVRSVGKNVRIQRVPAAPRLMVGPGDAITTGGSRCSVSAIGVGGGTTYVVTAGHCTRIGATWSAGGQTVGTRQATSFPGNDYGTIRVTNGSLPTSNANLTRVGRPAVGTQILKKGSTTGTTSGTIRGYGRTVNYSEGTVTDMIETTACVQPGDSGGSLQGGSTAIGITSGGTTGACRSGTQSFFQPLDEALQSQRLTLK